MLDIRWIRENPEALDRALAARGAPPAAGELIALDEARRAAVQKLQDFQMRRNAASKEIGQAKAQNDEARAKGLMAEVASLKGLSGHGDANEMVRWLSQVTPAPRRVFLTHGEADAAEALAAKITKERGFPTHVPALSETVEL